LRIKLLSSIHLLILLSLADMLSTNCLEKGNLELAVLYTLKILRLSFCIKPG